MKCSKPLLRRCLLFSVVAFCSIFLLISSPIKAYAYNTNDYTYQTNYIGGALVSYIEFDTSDQTSVNAYTTLPQSEGFSYVFEAEENETFVSVFKDALYIENTSYGNNECYMFFRAGDNTGVFTIDITYSYLDRYGYHFVSNRETFQPLQDFYLLDYIIDNSTNYDGYHIILGLQVDVSTTNIRQSSCQFVYEGSLSSKTIPTINSEVSLLVANAFERVTLVENPTLWLKNAVSNFLDFEIMPNLSLKHILYIVLAFGLLLAILKIWLGG